MSVLRNILVSRRPPEQFSGEGCYEAASRLISSPPLNVRCLVFWYFARKEKIWPDLLAVVRSMGASSRPGRCGSTRGRRLRSVLVRRARSHRVVRTGRQSLGVTSLRRPLGVTRTRRFMRERELGVRARGDQLRYRAPDCSNDAEGLQAF